MVALIKREVRSNDDFFSLPKDFLTLIASPTPQAFPRIVEGRDGFLVETEQFSLRFEDTSRKEIKDIAFITQRGITRRYHITVTQGSFGKYNGIESLIKDLLGDKSISVTILRQCRFKVDINDRYLMANGRKIAKGLMSSDPDQWQGDWLGQVWKSQIGEDFSKFIVNNFELNWVHKVVCQRRGQYQFLPHVALFFDNPNELVLKLVNRPNDRDSCEGFYVGKLFGKAFGYHIDGSHTKIPFIDDYMKGAVEDIIHRPLTETDLCTERFAVDAHYDRIEGRWALHSTLGEIGHLVKGVTPANTCDIRKHITWTYTVFGESIKNVPLLEGLLVQAFNRAWKRPSAHHYA